MTLPRLVITGASGFIGRHLLDSLKDRYQIFGMARRSQARSGAPVHPNITWFQVDIGDREPLTTAFRAIRDAGGAEVLIHLAAHYDFTGDDHPEYWRTNVDGLRNVLDLSRDLGLERLVFASSVAACGFPPPGGALTEASPPDGDHIYAITKRLGEEMLGDYDDIPSCIVRFAALFSDWCEYPPLYFFLETWLSRAWNARMLGGKGQSAIPYLHVRDLAVFFHNVLARQREIGQREVLIASPSSVASHNTLFDLAHLHAHGRHPKPVHLPKALCGIGMWARDLAGRMLGNRPFERPWMARYIDLELAVDSSRTQQRLSWTPRERLLVNRRIPFLLENRKTEPLEWHRRNRAALKEVQLRDNLRIHQLLECHHDRIRDLFVAAIFDEPQRFPTYQAVPREILAWRFTVILRHLLNAMRTGERGVLTAYCRDLAHKRFGEGFSGEEVCAALMVLNRTAIQVLSEDPESEGLGRSLEDYLTMSLQLACDQLIETFEELGGEVYPSA